jgi:hypothetical protein
VQLVPTPPPPTPDLWAVVAPASAAASVGTLAGILASLRQINPDLQFRWDMLSLGAGLAGAASAWALGRGLWRLGRHQLPPVVAARLGRQVVGGFIGLGVVVFLCFAVAAGGLPDQRRREMIAGAVLALLVLGAVGWTLLRLARLFGSPDEPADTTDAGRRPDR